MTTVPKYFEANSESSRLFGKGVFPALNQVSEALPLFQAQCNDLNKFELADLEKFKECQNNKIDIELKIKYIEEEIISFKNTYKEAIEESELIKK